MDIRAAEISAILKSQIANFGEEADVSDVGQVLKDLEQASRPVIVVNGSISITASCASLAEEILGLGAHA